MQDITVMNGLKSIESLTAQLGVERMGRAKRYPAYVGIDQHKEWLVVAVAFAGRAEPEDWGRFPNTRKGVKQLLKRLARRTGGEVASLCYEAGPCGYGLYRCLRASGHDCLVVAPSTIPQPRGRRRKTDRRDARSLARRHRSGDLDGITVPDEEQERMRDLTRCRGDAKDAQRKARQRLNAYLLRHDVRYTLTQSRWNKTHLRWLCELRLAEPVAQAVLDQYVAMERTASERLAEIEALMREALVNWSQAQWVYELKALRGMDTIAAMGLVAELGDLRRFAHPRQLMAFLGLVPGEHSSGDRIKRLSTGSGNRHARRLLIEAAWCYRFPARVTAHLRRAMRQASPEAKAISWKAQKRLCGRYRKLIERGKSTKKVVVAVARELCGFLWAIYQAPPVR